MNLEGGGSVLKNQFQGGGGGRGSALRNQFEGGGVELNDQLLDPDVPTLASQDKLKVSPKGLPFILYMKYKYHVSRPPRDSVMSPHPLIL